MSLSFIKELQARIAQLEADAARYRWLRDRPRGPLNGSEFMTGICIDVWEEDGSGEQLSGEKADAAVDAAREAGKESAG